MMSQEEIHSFMAKMQQNEQEEEATVQPVRFPPIKPPSQGMPPIKASLSHLEDVTMEIYAELGQTCLKIRELLNLNVGSVIELNKAAGDTANVYVNNQPFAKGEILVINDYFSVRLTQITQPSKYCLFDQLKDAAEGI